MNTNFNPELQCFFNGNDHLQNMFTSGWPGFDGDQLGNYGYMNRNTVLNMTPLGANRTFPLRNSNSPSVSDYVSPKKRKAEKGQTLQVVSEKEKKIKTCAEEGDSKITHQNSNSDNKQNSTNNSSKASDYIHVRARRGQATDSHSLAERVRREKISERMKYLQGLVPGCNKITGKAGMLDEIINYVQSLQKQVEFLSMKLATVNPETNFNIDNLFTKEVFTTNEFQGLGCSSETANSAHFQLDQVVSYCGLDIGINSAEVSLRSISTPISIPETFMDLSCFNVIASDLSPSFCQL